MSAPSGGPEFLLTRWGTLVYRDAQGGLRHGNLGHVPDDCCLTEAGIITGAPSDEGLVERIPLAGTRLHHLARDGQFFCADANGRVTGTSESGADWGRFLLLNRPELDTLLAIGLNDWVLPNARVIGRREIELAADFTLNFGRLVINLAAPAGVAVTEMVGGRIAALLMLQDGWKLISARRFKPLIYFAVFGADHIFEMLRLCLDSIAAQGSYSGHVFILSDRSAADAARFVPPELGPRTLHGYRAMVDRAGMMMGRFDMSDLPIDDFQPILCLDADMVCDGPIMAMMAACGVTDLCAGSAEFGGVCLAEMSQPIGNWFGRFLFEATGTNLADVCGLNGGAIAFPNKTRAVTLFKLIDSAFKKFNDEFPDRRGYGEQPILNHSFQSGKLINARALNKYIQFRNQCLNTTERHGLMHFNYDVGGNKLADMRKYYEAIAPSSRVTV